LDDKDTDAFGRDHEPREPRQLQINPMSREQEDSLRDSNTSLAEWNTKLAETIVAQADQIMQLARENRELRHS
jgi:hypothetical protein